MTLLAGGLAPSRDQTIPQLVAHRKVTTIAYENWSFTRVSNCSELILQNFSILVGGGRVREAAACGGSTVVNSLPRR